MSPGLFLLIATINSVESSTASPLIFVTISPTFKSVEAAGPSATTSAILAPVPSNVESILIPAIGVLDLPVSMISEITLCA